MIKSEALYAELGYLQNLYDNYEDKRKSPAVATRKEIEEVQAKIDQIETKHVQ